jgi:hypothetical protein
MAESLSGAQPPTEAGTAAARRSALEPGASPVVASVAPLPATVAEDANAFYDAYSRFSNTLRGWLVGYGIGGPVLLATQDKLAQRLTDAGVIGDVIQLFLLAITLQVVEAILYKYAMWYQYRAASGDSGKWFQRASEYLSTATWLEASFDVASVGLLASATWVAIRVGL